MHSRIPDAALPPLLTPVHLPRSFRTFGKTISEDFRSATTGRLPAHRKKDVSPWIDSTAIRRGRAAGTVRLGGSAAIYEDLSIVWPHSRGPPGPRRGVGRRRGRGGGRG